MKERDNAPEKELNAMETGLPDAELETTVMRVVYALKGRADELGESRDQETENVEVEIENKTRKQPEMKNTITIAETTAACEGLGGGGEAAEDRIGG